MPRLIALIVIVLSVVFIGWLWIDQTGQTSDGTQPAPRNRPGWMMTAVELHSGQDLQVLAVDAILA
ncbi:hypothetical protein [Mesorhizobium delmotii]|uniref:Uncharacterized protein n=1 Tax=Mesorhizobium delmotii TaxID=1631247 RepID=A0A2P9ANE9_9HYPH|nr:hypothetical protein [Mesorhizobium delmotii]SJM32598.1 hypothetical protein BQ8482_30054 [Mesorhizobium delmotii]